MKNPWGAAVHLMSAIVCIRLLDVEPWIMTACLVGNTLYAINDVLPAKGGKRA